MDLQVDKKTLVVFDLDDTLYNELDYLRSAYRELASRFETRWLPLYARLFSLYREGEDAFAYLSREYEVDKSELVEAYRSHKPRIEVFPGVKPLLAAIKAQGGITAIITDGRSSTQRAKIKALGIEGWIDRVLISEETGYEKPDLHNFNLLQAELTPARAYYIGDNLNKDFLAPNTLGWRTIGIVDNGKNIHSHGHRYFDEAHLPSCFIEAVGELQVELTTTEEER